MTETHDSDTSGHLAVSTDVDLSYGIAALAVGKNIAGQLDLSAIPHFLQNTQLDHAFESIQKHISVEVHNSNNIKKSKYSTLPWLTPAAAQVLPFSTNFSNERA